MKKIITLFSLSLGILLLAGCGQKEVAMDQSQGSDMTYKNEVYGFEMTFPETWKGYSTTDRTLDWGTLGKSDSIDFGLPGEEALLNVSFNAKDQWEKIKTEGGPIPSVLGESDKFVFAYSTAQSVSNGTMAERLNEVPEIIKTFKLTDVVASAQQDFCADFPENTQLIQQPFKIDTSKGPGYDAGYGYATVTGTVVKKTINYEGVDPGTFTEKAYFVLQEPTTGDSEKAFYKYFKGMLDSGNTVNMSAPESPKVGFVLGALEGEKFSSTAIMSDATKAKIIDSMNTGSNITLTLRVPKYEGRGAPENFSFACKID